MSRLPRKPINRLIVVFCLVSLVFLVFTFLLTYKRDISEYQALCPHAVGYICPDEKVKTNFSLGLPLVFLTYESLGYNYSGHAAERIGNTPVKKTGPDNTRKIDFDPLVLLQNLAINLLIITSVIYIAHKLMPDENTGN